MFTELPIYSVALQVRRVIYVRLSIAMYRL